LAASDLDAAFIAAIGHPPPSARDVQQPLSSVENPNQVSEHAARTFSLRPERLVPLGDRRFALIIQEVDEGGAHAFPGALAVAYLTKEAGAWRLEKLWPEIAYVGNSGKPNYKSEVKDFGRGPLYVSTSKYCQMGGCEDDVDIIVLDSAMPRYIGGFAGDSVFPTVFPHPLDGNCETYDYKVSIAPPATPGDLLSVTYRGWTAPAGHRSPKKPFRVQADATIVGDNLELRPEVTIPDCGK